MSDNHVAPLQHRSTPSSSILSIYSVVTKNTDNKQRLKATEENIVSSPYLSNEWKQKRRLYVGASQLAAILGISEYTSLKSIYDQKHNGVFPVQTSFSMNALQYGTETETLAYERLQTIFEGKRTLTRNPRMKLSPKTMLLGASVDILEQIEIKCPYSRQPFKEVENIPIDNILQTATYCHVYDTNYWDLFYYWSDETYAMFRIQSNEPFFEKEIIPAVEQFCSGLVDVEINTRRKGRKGKVTAAVRAAFPVSLLFASF